MTYRVDISQPAAEDAENGFLWIQEESLEKAIEWYQGLRKAIQSLKEHPKRCPIAPEGRLVSKEVRHLLYGKKRQQYRILFGISVDKTTGEDIVVIYRIRHASQLYLETQDILGKTEQ